MLIKDAYVKVINILIEISDYDKAIDSVELFLDFHQKIQTIDEFANLHYRLIFKILDFNKFNFSNMNKKWCKCSREYWISIFKKIDNFLNKNFDKNLPNILFEKYSKQIVKIQEMLNNEQGFILFFF